MADGRFPVLAVVGSTVTMRETLSWFETKPLFGWEVLVPRTKEQSGSTIARLEHHGAQAAVVPTISVEPPRTPQQLERAVKGMVTGRYEWVGFTSVNAVRAIREKFDEFGLDARSFAGLKVAAVGGVTAQALRDWGIVADLVPSGEQSARGLLEEWPDFDPDLDPINRVFLPRADIATDTLVAGLQEMGWEVDDVTAYRTVRAAPPAAAVRDAIKNGSFDAVLFTSSSTVRNLVGIAGKPHPTTVVACIGPATAKTAEEHGLRVDVLAPEPTAEALVDALADHGRSLALAAQEAGRGRAAAQPAPSRRPPTGHLSVGGLPVRRGRGGCGARPALRRLVAETRLHPAELVLPVFVREGIDAPGADLGDARGRAAHPGVARRSRRGAVSTRGSAASWSSVCRSTRTPAGRAPTTPTASSTSRSRGWSRRSVTTWS